MTNERVVFLDIDGVLNTTRMMRRTGKQRPFDPEAVAALNRVLAETGARIVVSSTWRHNRSIVELDQILRLEGLPGGLVIGKTPDLCVYEESGSWRGSGGVRLWRAVDRRLEIAAWLKEHPEVTAWCAIDDDHDAGPENLVHCDDETGLTDELAARAIELLRIRL